MVGRYVPVAGSTCDGDAGCRDRHTARGDAAGGVGAVEHAVGVVRQENGVGLAAVIEDDALGVLCQQLDEHRLLRLVVGRQSGVTHLHRVIVEAVGEAPCPRTAADAVFGHVRPVGQAVQKSAAAEHHGGGGQRTGAAPALLEVKSCVHVEVHRQRSRQHHCHQHERQHKGHQFFPDPVRRTFHV